MELRQLTYFVGVAHELHFGRAAKKLFVTQSALSQQIKLLEVELGVELFVGIQRSKWHKVELTEAGALFLIDAERILQLSEKAIRTVRQTVANQQAITLGVFKFILPERIMGMLELFSTHFPTLSIKLVELSNTTEVQEWVAAERVDLGMTVLPLVCDGLSATPYAEADYSILMNRNHPLATQKGVLLEQIQHEKWIDVGQVAGVFFMQAEEICRLANINRSSNIVQQVPSFDLLKSMVRLGKGIAFIPAALDLSQEPSLLSMPILNADGTPFKQVVIQHILIHKSDHPTPLVQSLAGLIKMPGAVTP
ncbi:LysR family transcriptional regulator [Spirosoma endbachense]|uniref:LysR family transcriptional regulator n=1 Tax=Spirosoma endbachense TaxID=2666025 RepID=A0A6P1VMH5_9BACT|nr:LysR family transcriptional regulator [Spirosoma endbachense]QHV93885.1 LysR family transcriptional regulator [Spirosoma endbachense]